jgi:hypothetical protein
VRISTGKTAQDAVQILWSTVSSAAELPHSSQKRA